MENQSNNYQERSWQQAAGVNTQSGYVPRTGMDSQSTGAGYSQATGAGYSQTTGAVYSQTAAPGYARPIGNATANRAQGSELNAARSKERSKKRFWPRLLVALALGLSFGILAAVGFWGVNKFVFKNEGAVISTDTTELQSQIDDLTNRLRNVEAGGSTASQATLVVGDASDVMVTDVTQVVEFAMPSMVSITNLYEQTSYYWGRQYTQEYEASGSGIIIGENNTEFMIVTNYHVVEGCKKLTVSFVDDTQADAYLKGYDESVDIAVIAVPKGNLLDSTMTTIKVATIGDSDTLVIGEPAIAIGNALGYGQSVTTGVISALNRDIAMQNTYNALIQTSAAINPGNSGGALLNIKGEVIGINSNKLGGSAIEGMGYAIPISAVRGLIEEIMQKTTPGSVTQVDNRGYLGISGATVDSTTIETYGVPAGVYMSKIFDNSAAEAAGMQRGDIVTKVEGQDVLTLSELQDILSTYKAGDVVTLTIMRLQGNDYVEMEIQATLTTKDAIGG